MHKETLKNYFGKSKIFETREQAFQHAEIKKNEMLENGLYTLEDDICFIGKHESFIDISESNKIKEYLMLQSKDIPGLRPLSKLKGEIDNEFNLLNLYQCRF